MFANRNSLPCYASLDFNADCGYRLDSQPDETDGTETAEMESVPQGWDKIEA